MDTTVPVGTPRHRLWHKRPKLAPILINGKKIRMLPLKIIFWGLVVGTLVGVGVVAGLYFNVLEVRWFVHIAAFHVFSLHIPEFNHGSSLKLWWDNGMGIFHSPSWSLYRHGERNDGEPALAIMIAMTVMAKRKSWDKKVGRARLVLTPPLMVILTIGLIAGAIWLQYFGLPNAWHAFFGDRHIYVSSLASLWAVAETIAFGAAVSHILKPLWAPVGAYIQGVLVDRMVDKWWIHKGHRAFSFDGPYPVFDPKKMKLPFWVRHFGPPAVRQRFVKTVEDDTTPDEEGKMEAVEVIQGGSSRRDSHHRGLWTAGILMTGYLVITGLLAKYWIGAGHSFPYLAPAKAATAAAAHAIKFHTAAIMQLIIRH